VSAPGKAEIFNPLTDTEYTQHIYDEKKPDLTVSQHLHSQLLEDCSIVAKTILDEAMTAAAKCKATSEALVLKEAEEAEEKTPTIAEIEAYLKHLKEVESRKPKK